MVPPLGLDGRCTVYVDEFDGIGVHQVLQIGADVPLQVLGPVGMAHGQIHFRDHSGVKLTVGHGLVHQLGDGRQLLADAVDVVLGQVGHGAIDQPLVAEDESVTFQGLHELLAGQVVHHVVDEGDHGVLQDLFGHEGVAGEADVVGGDDADVVRGVAGGADDAEFGPAEVDLGLPKLDHPVHRADEGLEPGIGPDKAHGKVEEVVLQALLTADDVSLQLGQAGQGPVLLPEVLGALVVVVVHVGADDPHRGPPGSADGLVQVGLELAAAGVQDDALVAHHIQADELGAIGHPGVAFYVG